MKEADEHVHFDYKKLSCFSVLIPTIARELYFLHTGYGYLRFYHGKENLILPMLSYPDCHVRATCIGCIGIHAYGRQVTSLVC